jgi:hypothetical protein
VPQNLVASSHVIFLQVSPEGTVARSIQCVRRYRAQTSHWITFPSALRVPATGFGSHHFNADLDPDPAYHFIADPDLDSEFQFN